MGLGFGVGGGDNENAFYMKQATSVSTHERLKTKKIARQNRSNVTYADLLRREMNALMPPPTPCFFLFLFFNFTSFLSDCCFVIVVFFYYGAPKFARKDGKYAHARSDFKFQRAHLLIT